jgi:hypothetical protein
MKKYPYGAGRRRRMTGWVLCVAVLAAGVLGVGVAAADDESDLKVAIDTDPHLALTPYQEQMQTAKVNALNAYFTTLAGVPVDALSESDGSPANVDAALAAAPASKGLAQNQVAQQTSYWCGPAAVVEALGQIGYAISQTTAAAKLGTTTDGTAWSGGHTMTGFPVPDVLNLYQTRNYYIPQSVAVTPTAANQSNYKLDLVNNVTHSVPMVGDAFETAASAHLLVGHPAKTTYHWFDIRGYADNGANTMYEDSVHGASTIGWSASVPAYSTLPSSWIVGIVGGRGYVW